MENLLHSICILQTDGDYRSYLKLSENMLIIFEVHEPVIVIDVNYSFHCVHNDMFCNFNNVSVHNFLKVISITLEVGNTHIKLSPYLYLTWQYNIIGCSCGISLKHSFYRPVCHLFPWIQGQLCISDIYNHQNIKFTI